MRDNHHLEYYEECALSPTFERVFLSTQNAQVLVMDFDGVLLERVEDEMHSRLEVSASERVALMVGWGGLHRLSFG